MDCQACQAERARGSHDKDVDRSRRNCCLRRMLEYEPDFLEQRTVLEEIAAELGFKVLFLPKFHCELNFIEMFWGTRLTHIHARTCHTYIELIAL